MSVSSVLSSFDRLREGAVPLRHEEYRTPPTCRSNSRCRSWKHERSEAVEEEKSKGQRKKKAYENGRRVRQSVDGPQRTRLSKVLVPQTSMPEEGATCVHPELAHAGAADDVDHLDPP